MDRTARDRGRTRVSVVAVAGGAALLSITGMIGAPVAVHATGTLPSGDTVTACTSIDDWPTRHVSAPVRAAVVDFYRARDLLPVRIVHGREYVLDVDEQRVGTHTCLNPDGSTAGYVGNVPRWATRAVMVQARHKPYPVTEAPSNFVTLAKGPGHAWTVVSEDTGP